jgi:hypothetical protein
MTMQLSKIEKALFAAADGDETGAVAFAKAELSKPECYELINKLAQERRARGESREVAFARFATEDVFGRELMSVLQSKRGPDHHGVGGGAFAKVAAPAVPTKTPALLELEHGAAQLAKMAKLTPEVAFAKLCDTEYGAQQLRLDKEQRGILAKEDDAGGGNQAMEQFTRLARQHASTTGQSMSDSIDAVLRTKAGADLWRAAKHARVAA